MADLPSSQSERIAELEAEVTMLRDSMEKLREAKSAELFGRSPEQWLDIQGVLREGLSKGYGRKAWRDRAWKVLHG